MDFMDKVEGCGDHILSDYQIVTVSVSELSTSCALSLSDLPVGVVSLLLPLPKRENFFFPFELDCTVKAG